MDDSARVPRRRGRSESTRRRILDATEALIDELGLEGATIEGIAARAGVGKQTIYRGWGDRTALLAEALVETWQLPDIRASGDAREDVVAWGIAVVDSVASARGRAVMRLMGAAAGSDEQLAERIEERFTDPMRERLRALLNAVDSSRATRGATDAIMGGLFFRMGRGVASSPDDVRAIVDAVLT